MFSMQRLRSAFSPAASTSTPPSFTWSSYLGTPNYPELPNDVTTFVAGLSQTTPTQVTQARKRSIEDLVKQILTNYDNDMTLEKYKSCAVAPPKLAPFYWPERTALEENLTQCLLRLPSIDAADAADLTQIFIWRIALFLAVATRPGTEGNTYPVLADIQDCVAVAAFPIFHSQRYFERMLAFSFDGAVRPNPATPASSSEASVPSPFSSSTDEVPALGSSLAGSSSDTTIAAVPVLASFQSKKLTGYQAAIHLWRLCALSLHARDQKRPIEALFIIVENTLQLSKVGRLAFSIDWAQTLQYLGWQSDVATNNKLSSRLRSQLYSQREKGVLSMSPENQNLSAQLALAVTTKSLALIEMLVLAGADPYIGLQRVVRMPLPGIANGGHHLHPKYNFSKEQQAFIEAQMTLLLRLAPGLDLNIRSQDESGFTLLQYAISANNTSVISRLLAIGANPNVTNNHGNSALTHFVKHVDIIRKNMKKRADALSKLDYGLGSDSRDKFIRTILQEIFNMLMASPIDLLISNAQGDTAVSALELDNADYMFMLLKIKFGDKLIEETLQSYQNMMQEGVSHECFEQRAMDFVRQGFRQYPNYTDARKFNAKMGAYRQTVWGLFFAEPARLVTTCINGETLLTAAVKAKHPELFVIRDLIHAKRLAEHWLVPSEFFEAYAGLETLPDQPGDIPISEVRSQLMENYLHLGAHELNEPFNKEPVALQLLTELYARTMALYPEVDKNVLLEQLQGKLAHFVNIRIYLFRQTFRLAAGNKSPNAFIHAFTVHLKQVKQDAPMSEIDEWILQTAIISAAKSQNLFLKQTPQSGAPSVGGSCTTTSWDGMPTDGLLSPASLSNVPLASPPPSKNPSPPTKTADEVAFEALFNNAKELSQDALLPTFVDPISAEFMIDPVITPEGDTYERYVIETWLLNNKTEPLRSEVPLSASQLVPNRALKELMDAYKVRKLEEHRKAQTIQPENLSTPAASANSSISIGSSPLVLLPMPSSSSSHTTFMKEVLKPTNVLN